MPNILTIALIPLLPLVSFVVLGLLGKKQENRLGGLIATLLLAVATVLAFYTAYGYFFEYGKINGVYQKLTVFQLSWLQFSDQLSINIGAILDPVTAMMLIVVTFISLLVHVYSLAYLKGEKRFTTYYAFLGLFTFSMLALVLSSNIFQLYIFWELVGLSSFLLIGFYYDKPSAVAACKKAFIVTRFADLAFLIGILVLSFYSGTLDFATLIERLTDTATPAWQTATAASFLGVSALTWALVLVFIGGAGKSALFPLHIWLPDAMEGPTPVSALIHAATMVVAGVFLVARLFPVFQLSPPAMEVVSYAGIFTAFIAALMACSQTDIKRVLAYSTMSQIGFMMFALGVSKTTGEEGLGFMAAMFHLFTHALFKALLFLGAGAVIHFIHSNEMKDMGGLRKYLPITHGSFLIACLAISGIPPFAGFFSKEAILQAAYQHDPWIFYTALITSGITAFYMFRLYFFIFWNKKMSHHNDHGEGGSAMMMPLIILGIASCLAGFIPFGNFVAADGLPLANHFHLAFSIAPVAIALTGIGTAAYLFLKDNARPEKYADRLGTLYRIIRNKFYIDEVYAFITKKIIVNLVARPAAWFDKNIVDGLINSTGNSTVSLAEKIKAFQSGKVQQYAFFFLAGVVALAVIFIYVWK